MSDYSTGRTDYEKSVRGSPFIVRSNPQQIPTTAIDAQPHACALINLEWLSHLLGALDALNQFDAWQGTDEEVYNAQQEIERFANTLKDICTMSEGAQLQFRQTDCALEMSDDNGATWTEIYNAGCAKTIITYNPVTNNIEADGQPIVSGDTIINNTIIVDNTENLQPDGLDKRCDMASYYADLMLPSLIQELMVAQAQSSTNVDAISSLIGFAVAVTGFIFFTPATTLTAVAWVFGGLAVAETGAELGALIMNADPVAIDAETTAQFWQDVKCKIYCVLPSDGIVTPEVQQDIADSVATLTNYPATIPLLAESIRAFAPEAIGKFNIFGALYDGANCDLCSCAPWEESIFGAGWLSKYVTLQSGNSYNELTNWIQDDNATISFDSVTVTVDLSKTPAIITGWRGTAQAYGTRQEDEPRNVKIEVWDESAGAWSTHAEYPSNRDGQNIFPGGTLGETLPDPTTKVRMYWEGWGTNDPNINWQRLKIGMFLLQGVAVNVLQIEQDENGIVI